MGASEARAEERRPTGKPPAKPGMKVPLAFSSSEAVLVKKGAAGKPLAPWCKERVLAGLGSGNGPPPAEPPGSLSITPREPRANTIEKRDLSYRDLKEGQDYSRCNLDTLLHKIPKDLGFFDCAWSGKGGETQDGNHPLYPNCGLTDEDWKLLLVRCELPGCAPNEQWEFKIPGVTAIGCGTGKGKGHLRLRHGRRHVWVDCTDISEVTVRDGEHILVNLPGCSIAFYEGNLPWHAAARDGEQGWIEARGKVQAGQRMYSSGMSYVERVASVEVGRHSKNGGQFPAVGHVIHPDLRDVCKLSGEKGTRFEARELA